jgi:hypothetical protein
LGATILPTATPAKYLEVPVEVTVSSVKAVANRQSPSSGLETLSLEKARTLAASGPRAYAFLRDVDYAQQENTEYRVFIDCDYLSPETPITDRHYVGSLIRILWRTLARGAGSRQ